MMRFLSNPASDITYTHVFVITTLVHYIRYWNAAVSILACISLPLNALRCLLMARYYSMLPQRLPLPPTLAVCADDGGSLGVLN